MAAQRAQQDEQPSHPVGIRVIYSKFFHPSHSFDRSILESHE